MVSGPWLKTNRDGRRTTDNGRPLGGLGFSGQEAARSWQRTEDRGQRTEDRLERFERVRRRRTIEQFERFKRLPMMGGNRYEKGKE